MKFAELSKANPQFTTVQSPSGLPVRKVVMGDYHSVACDHIGAAFAWGENTAGQLGRGEMGSRGVGDLLTPTLINFGKGDESLGRTRSAATSAQNKAADRIQRDDNGDFKPAYRSRRFVFDVAAGGWQSGALVVDLQDCFLPAAESSESQDILPGRHVEQMNAVERHGTSYSRSGSESTAPTQSEIRSDSSAISDSQHQNIQETSESIVVATQDNGVDPGNSVAEDLEICQLMAYRFCAVLSGTSG